MILGVFVYSIGWLSGCHINPAVTLGLLSIKKIKVNEAVLYMIAQKVVFLLAMLGILLSILNEAYTVCLYLVSGAIALCFVDLLEVTKKIRKTS